MAAANIRETLEIVESVAAELLLRRLGQLEGQDGVGGERADGVVGVGCLREIADVSRAGLPIAMLDHRCRARTYAGLALPTRASTARRAAVLVPGKPVDLRELFELPVARGAP